MTFILLPPATCRHQIVPSQDSVLAAKLIAHTGQLHRFPDRGHYASYNGSAPIEASSGDRCRHRLNRGGNRQLNSALHIIAVCQIRDPGPGQAYYQRKLAEGKTPAEARRALKRRISDAIYRHLRTDHQRSNTPTP
jgi:transposase